VHEEIRGGFPREVPRTEQCEHLEPGHVWQAITGPGPEGSKRPGFAQQDWSYFGTGPKPRNTEDP